MPHTDQPTPRIPGRRPGRPASGREPLLRLEILVTQELRDAIEAEAIASGRSLSAIVVEAVNARFGL